LKPFHFEKVICPLQSGPRKPDQVNGREPLAAAIEIFSAVSPFVLPTQVLAALPSAARSIREYRSWSRLAGAICGWRLNREILAWSIFSTVRH
jgi:hypothetical protein